MIDEFTEDEWSCIDVSGDNKERTFTSRLEVPGGWLYRVWTEYKSGDISNIGVVFVPGRHD